MFECTGILSSAITEAERSATVGSVSSGSLHAEILSVTCVNVVRFV